MMKSAIKATNQRLLVIVALLSGGFSVLMFFGAPGQSVLQTLLHSIYLSRAPDTKPIAHLFNIIPLVILCVVTANYLREDFDLVSVFVLPRAGTVQRWYFSKAGTICLLAVEYTVIYFLTILFLQALFLKAALLRSAEITALLILFTHYALSIAAMLMFVNICSLLLEAKWSLPLLLVIVFVNLFCIHAFSKQQWIYWISPVANYFFTWHRTALPIKSAIPIAWPTPSLTYSFAYFGVLLAVLITLGSLSLRSQDIALHEKG